MVFEQITGALDLVFLPITVLPSHVAIFIISVAITSIILVLSRVVINRNVVLEIKKRMEEIRENLTKAQKEGRKEDVNKFLNDLMKTNNDYMKQTFKTMIVSLIIISLFLPWFANHYASSQVAKLPFTLPIIGSKMTWIYWYALVSLMAGWVARKIFGSEV